MKNEPITAIIVGAGHRALIYANLALTNPESLKIVGVADPNPVRRKQCMEKFGFSKDMCFEMQTSLHKKADLQMQLLTAQWTNSTLRPLFRF